MSAERDVGEPYGWSARIDLYDCDETVLRSADQIQAFVNSLCDDVLVMKRHGDTIIEWFGEHDEKATGFSFVQLIETSSVVGHVSEPRNSVYLDIFSCRPFDASGAAKLAAAHFGARAERTVMDTRR